MVVRRIRLYGAAFFIFGLASYFMEGYYSTDFFCENFLAIAMCQVKRVIKGYGNTVFS